jgi:hypothetical protein
VEETIPVTGAGLVLLHPFLNTLFEASALSRDGAFLSETARHSAVHLLGYLATGTPENDEVQLALGKLLTGMPLAEVLEPLPPDPAAQAAADELLQAVIGHWKGIGTSTPAWLREGFIARPGLIAPADRGWRLDVETRAQDVLLARLPWGFGVIALPWMAAPLAVRWMD